jgi:hypothetical protein
VQPHEKEALIQNCDPVGDRVCDLLSKYEARAAEWRKHVGIENICSAEDFWNLLDDDRNFSHFWADWKRNVYNPKDDLHVLFHFVFIFAPVAAAQADTERLGSFGHYLGDDRQSSITDEHLAQRMRSRANHPHAVQVAL